MSTPTKYEGHTPGPWEVETVSDAVRVTIGKGRQKWILARLATKQIPETETFSNGKLMADAPALEAENTRLREALGAFLSDPNASKCTYVNLEFARAALAVGKGETR